MIGLQKAQTCSILSHFSAVLNSRWPRISSNYCYMNPIEHAFLNRRGPSSPLMHAVCYSRWPRKLFSSPAGRNVESGVSQVSGCRFGDDDLHHLLLHRLLLLALHGATTVGVASVVEAEGTATVGVALELLDGSSGVLLAAEENDTSATRATVGLVLDLGLLNVADGNEELDKILVAGAPWQLLSC